MDEPTRGIDVGAKAEIHALMSRLAAAGTGAAGGVLRAARSCSRMCDRILVLCEGRVTGEFHRIRRTGRRRPGGHPRRGDGAPGRTEWPERPTMTTRRATRGERRRRAPARPPGGRRRCRTRLRRAAAGARLAAGLHRPHPGRPARPRHQGRGVLEPDEPHQRGRGVLLPRHPRGRRDAGDPDRRHRPVGRLDPGHRLDGVGDDAGPPQPDAAGRSCRSACSSARSSACATASGRPGCGSSRSS